MSLDPAASVAASVSYIDGVTGGEHLPDPAGGRARLAAAMGAPAPDEDAGVTPLTELELSALSEASNQMMATASAAISVVLGQELEISPPDTRVIDDPAAVAEHYGSAPHATSTTFTIDGESCRLIQLVPSAFVMRMARALDGLGVERLGGDDGARRGHGRRRASAWSTRSATSSCACGPSSAAPSCRSATRSACRSERSSSSTVGPTPRRPVRQRRPLRPGPSDRDRRRRVGVRARRGQRPSLGPRRRDRRAGARRQPAAGLHPAAVAHIPPASTTPQPTPNQKEHSLMARVLVVDDAAFMRKVVSDALSPEATT